MVVKITPNEKNNPPGKLADAELHFTEGVLDGLKLIGFSIWERRSGGGRNVTFQARTYSVNGERRSFALLRPIAEVPGATLVKLRRDKPKVSFLCYPEFDDEAHPTLRETFVADLRTLRTHHRDYTQTDNPPVLHRKECFVSEKYPRRQEFASLTEMEVEAGLLLDSADIRTRRGWEERLASRALRVQGHKLIRLDGANQA